MGEAIFFAVVLAAGCGGMAALVFTLVVPEWRVNHDFAETDCAVVKKSVGEIKGDDGPLYRPEFKIQYQVNGHTYCETTYDIHNAYSSGRDDKQAIVNDVAEGEEYLCWYDPDDPHRVVLVRGYTWWIWLVFSIPASFIVIGGVGLIYAMLHWGTSAERRAALARRAQDYAPFDGAARQAVRFPNIPNCTDITNSPGTRLRFRLPIAASPAWAVMGTLLACVLWNGIVTVFAVIAVRGFLEGRPDWFLTLFVVPFVVVGLGLVVLLVRMLLTTTGIGPTLLELSEHPLRPGGQCRLLLVQSGRLKMKRLRLALVCEEEATYRQGTNTRTETCRVYDQEVLCHEDFEIGSGLPFESQCDLSVPAGAMHSFKAGHNQVNWKLIVEGDAAGWRQYTRSFAILVHPAIGRAAS